VEGTSDEQPADVANAAWRDDRERQNKHERTRREDGQLPVRVRPTAPHEDCEGNEGQRIQLRGRAYA
jgi:hypothetical protein